MRKVFDFNVYALIDPGATLSFVTPFVAKNFHVESNCYVSLMRCLLLLVHLLLLERYVEIILFTFYIRYCLMILLSWKWWIWMSYLGWTICMHTTALLIVEPIGSNSNSQMNPFLSGGVLMWWSRVVHLLH